MTTTVKLSDLRIGDIVRLSDNNPFSDAIVKNVEGNLITLFRPYGANADFTYTGGVICYVGIEQFAQLADRASQEATIQLWRRQDLK